MFTVYEHTIGMPDYLDRDLGSEDDWFLFETQEEAESCCEVMEEGNENCRYYIYEV